MSSSNQMTKNYKILANSKHYSNMRGISPLEVSKKIAKKILFSSHQLTKSIQISLTETKSGKIYNYNAFREDLIRPYHKNGKLIKYRIIVKKMSNQIRGGGNTTPYTHYLSLLFENDVQAFIHYINEESTNKLGKSDNISLIKFGLFDNPSRVASRICEIYRVINWQDPEQNKQHFLNWLEGTFIPVKNKIKNVIPNIDTLVNEHLKGRCGKSFDEILENLRKFCQKGETPSD
jgi:hypothetical protein